MPELSARLASKIDQSGECWLWLASTCNGYGRYFANGKTHKAHRVVYEALVGPIPEGLTIDHLCRNRACVNPAHLEPVTMRVNLLRGESMQARNAKKALCVRGHRLSGSNVRIDWRGMRQCRKCDTLRSRESRRRARARA